MKKLFCIFGLLLLVFSCGKYDEGPDFSLSSKKTRLVNEWIISKVIENGTDITSSWNVMYASYSIKYTKDNTIVENINSTVLAKTWEFGDKKETVIIKKEYGGTTQTQTNTILRLTKDEYWFTTTIDNKDYRFELKSK